LNNWVIVQMINVVVKMVYVVLFQNIVLIKKDVKQNMVNALKINVEKNGDHLLMINVVAKDVKLNMVNVLKVNVVNFGDLVQKDNVIVKKDIVLLLQNSILLLKDAIRNMANVK